MHWMACDGTGVATRSLHSLFASFVFPWTVTNVMRMMVWPGSMGGV
jgi:hypothetical protein